MYLFQPCLFSTLIFDCICLIGFCLHTQLFDPHAALLAAHEAATFLSPIAFAKPFDALRGEVWVSDCDGMRVLCWGAFQP
jgi:hypothetical protein